MGIVLHTPVMQEQVAKYLLAHGAHRLIDATVGTGGHSRYLLRTGGSDLCITGIDRDQVALLEARKRLEVFGSRVELVLGNFRDLKLLVAEGKYDGILADLGLSSLQLSDPGRGLSYLQDGPLDMAMGEDGRSVRDLIGSAEELEISRILKTFGEVRNHRRIAREIIEARMDTEITTTFILRAVVERVIPVNGSIPILSRVFQAFRIWANRELESLEVLLPQAVDILETRGRLAVISYHSLEDRIVKRFFRAEEKGCTCPPDFPECRCGKKPRLKILTRRPISPSAEEIKENQRSRSAKLRIAERL